MKLHGSLLVIISCLVVAFCNVNQKEYLLFEMTWSIRILLISVAGLSFLVYPYVGHITDVYLTRYRSLKCSFILLIVAFCTALVFLGFCFAIADILNFTAHPKALYIPICVIYVVYIVGLGLFQANVIQFGLDQLLEAPTPKLIAFIHWYYWAQNVGSLALFYTAGSSILVVGARDVTNNTLSQLTAFATACTPAFILFIFMTIAVTAVLITFCAKKKDFYIQEAGLNPFKMVYKVLKYSWKHKVPEHRSAFTYWEDDIPRRIDLGKNKYGGPFTNEEVEDTKTFFRILPLLAPMSVWIPSSRRWLLSSRSAPEDQLSFTASTATDYIQSTPLEHSCLSSWYTTVSTGDYESVSKSEECSNADKNVDRSIPLTTSSSLVYHSGC